MQAESPGATSTLVRPHKVLSRIAVVGVGALGSELCRQLAETGAPDVLLIDPDRLEERNLRTSPLYRQAAGDFGDDALLSSKAELTAAFVERSFGLRWQALPEEIADVGLHRLRNYDVICCCGDSALCRVETALAARTLGLPMLDGGVFSEGVDAGRATWFAASPASACYLCGLTEARRAELLSFAASASLGCAAPAQTPPMTGTLSAVESTAAAMLSLLRQQPERTSGPAHPSEALRLNRRGPYSADNCAPSGWTEEPVRLVRSSTCPWHETPAPPLTALPWQTSLSVAFAGEAAGCILQCMWPMCLVARCRMCGEASRPLRRVAWVRRRGQCLHCGTLGSLEPIECLDAIRAEDTAATCTPRQLGMPDDHLYSFRPAWDLAAMQGEAHA